MNTLQADYSQAAESGGGNSTPSSEQLLSLLAIARGLEEKVEKSLAEVQLSSAKFGVLHHLVQAGEAIPLSELAARVNCVRSNVTQMVDRLETEGLVRRLMNPADRRIILAQLTEAGRARHQAGQARMDQMEHELAGSLSPADRVVLRRAMETLK